MTGRHLLLARRSTMTSDKYQLISTPNVHPQNIYQRFCSVAANAEQDDDLKMSLLGDGTCAVPRQIAIRTVENVKTHRAAGDVRLAFIHAVTSSPFTHFCAWLRHQLRGVVATLPHLLRDTSDLIRRLRSFAFEPRDVLVVRDIEDFYMTGKHEDRASSASAL